MELSVQAPSGFTVLLHGEAILKHSREEPLFYVGKCRSSYAMRLGHFVCEHKIESKVSVQIEEIKEMKRSEMFEILFADETNSSSFRLKLMMTGDRFQMEFPRTARSEYIRSVIEDDEIILRDESKCADEDETSVWFSLKALPFDEESISGCGLEFGDNNHRGKILPIWVSEWYHDQLYSDANTGVRPPAHTTYHPQPMFHSSRGYTFCAYGSAYAQFDFSNENCHSLYFADLPYRLEMSVVGRCVGCPLYPLLPEWIHDGVILGVQGGSDVVDQKLRKMSECGTKIAAIWAQDWCGKRITSFGKRVFWNWQWSDELYPKLKDQIVRWKEQYDGCRFLAYINPYIAVDGSLFKEANEKDFLVKRLDSENVVYLIDFGEFNGAIVDLTNPKAFQWYKEVIMINLIDIGISGWMADFGEYLPTDVRVHANIPGSLIHNLWPILWARCNHQAIRDSGKLNEIFFFMRSGYLNIQRFSPVFWTGDQSVNFSEENGLSAAIRSCLSLSLSDVLCVHTDIGGYFSRETIRTREVLLRWCEMETFNILMRTHEGNRPGSNVQFDHDSLTMQFFSRMSRIHYQLKPYTRDVLRNAYENKRSCLRPHQQFQYFVGDDLFIAPIRHVDQTKCKVSLPDGQWTHLWTNRLFEHNIVEIDAPIGYPPVFYRTNSKWKDLFQQIAEF